MSSPAGFEHNLRALGRGHPALAASLRELEAEGIEVVRGPGGAETLSCRGVLLGSAYDPVREGERMAAEVAAGEPDLVVAIGFGLGHHLEALHAAHRCPVVVYEPDPACLRAVLALRGPIPLLSRPEVHFAADLRELAGLVERLYVPGTRLRVLPHPAAIRLCGDRVLAAARQVSRSKDSVDVMARTRIRMTRSWAELTVDNLPHLLRCPPFSRLEGRFAGRPAVIAAAGPSLDKQLPLLREHRDRVVIIGIGQSFGALTAADVVPDLVHVVESQDVAHQIAGAPRSREAVLALLPSVHPALFELSVRGTLVTWPVANQIGRFIAEALGVRSWVAGGATVAQSAVYLAVTLGCDPILLIGQDLAFAEGRVYARNTPYQDVGYRAEGRGRFSYTGWMQKAALLKQEHLLPGGAGGEHEVRDLVEVEGWDGRPVPTTVAYASFREHYRDIGRHLRAHGIRLVNCTEGGARIPELPHLRFRDALAEWAVQPVRASEAIGQVIDAYRPPSPRVFARPLKRARRVLDEIEARARRNLERVRRAERRIRSARTPGVRLEALREVAGVEERMRAALGRLEWVDAVIQPEIHEALRAGAGRGSAPPLPEEAVEECERLLRAALVGAERARELLARFEERWRALEPPETGAERGACLEDPDRR